MSISLRDGVQSDLVDAQKNPVGDRFFIVLSAMLGGTRIHDLGGCATVMLGYTLPPAPMHPGCSSATSTTTA